MRARRRSGSPTTREVIKTDFPLMRAIVYFNANKDYDWRLTTSDSALEAFRQMANDPWFNLGVNRPSDPASAGAPVGAGVGRRYGAAGGRIVRSRGAVRE